MMSWFGFLYVSLECEIRRFDDPAEVARFDRFFCVCKLYVVWKGVVEDSLNDWWLMKILYYVDFCMIWFAGSSNQASGTVDCLRFFMWMFFGDLWLYSWSSSSYAAYVLAYYSYYMHPSNSDKKDSLNDICIRIQLCYATFV